MFNKIRATVFVLMMICGGLWCVAEYYEAEVKITKLERRTDLGSIADGMLKSMLNKP
jgi:PBP1b-binding outer membrane lipoprotein LpoB